MITMGLTRRSRWAARLSTSYGDVVATADRGVGVVGVLHHQGAAFEAVVFQETHGVELGFRASGHQEEDEENSLQCRGVELAAMESVFQQR